MAPETSDEQRFASALLKRAEEDRRRLLQEAAKEAQQLRQEAEHQIARLRTERLDAARRRARERLDSQLSEIRQQQRAEEARLVDEARARVMEAAELELSAIRERPEYPAYMRGMLDHAVKELGAGTDLTLTVDERDRECIGAVLRNRRPKAIHVVTGGPFLGGLQVSTRDGRSTIDYTFDARLLARRSSIHVQLARLFSRAD
jgi:vacuolar-type H+-ATPase subunit E/Vma4